LLGFVRLSTSHVACGRCSALVRLSVASPAWQRVRCSAGRA